MKTSLTFDDVLIEPAYSDIESRDSIYIGQPFLGIDLAIPILSSPMSSITEVAMAEAMYKNGGLGVLHRFADSATQVRWIDELEKNSIPIILSTGLSEKYVGLWNGIYAINIDTAHGHRREVIELIWYIRTLYPELKIIAGNVATQDGFVALAEAGAHAVRVGIGPGAACTTREMTGIGVPQLSAIQEVNWYRNLKYPKVKIIADGGIKNSGDMVKALAAGADVVMLGKVLASTEEASGELTSEYGYGGDVTYQYRKYMGQSMVGTNGTKKAPEGAEGWVRVNTTVKDVLESWGNYLRSGMSYVGARNLIQLREKAMFVQVTPNSLKESGTRL